MAQNTNVELPELAYDYTDYTALRLLPQNPVTVHCRLYYSDPALPAPLARAARQRRRGVGPR